ncbi:MAG: hypothetical protein IPK12_17640 [Gemmatimonadetes bacterium]|nr:hypothetical protein [Gemmatimonadota bacterium]
MLTATAATRAILREPERLAALRALIAEGASEGMQTFEQHAGRLVDAGDIAAESAAALGMATPAP